MTMDKNNNAIVYVVDNEHVIRDSLCLLFESAGLSTRSYESAEDFLMDYDPERPGCLILDMVLPSMSGFELQEKLLEQGALMPIIFMSRYANVSLSSKAFRLGAMDFFEKPIDSELFLGRVTEVLEKNNMNWDKKQNKKSLLNRYSHLTNREKEVMQLVTNDHSNKETAKILGISYRTVDIHRARLMQKMQASSSTQLIIMAVNCGLVQCL
jgi:FixJ family two-component response regulator